MLSPSEENIPEEWRWKLRLFTSVDIVGSTSYKSTQLASGSPEWVPTFTEFFREFPDTLRAQYDLLPPPPEHYSRDSKLLVSWKFLGDEILFAVELARHEDAASHVLAFKKALRTFPDAWWRKKNIPLGLKGAAWIAGFPVTNREVQITASDKSLIQDFIGPSIDLGFRVTKFADERRLVLSADLALLILDGVDGVEWEKKQFSFEIRERQVLKGVMGNDGYPIVAIHMNDGDLDANEELFVHICEWTKLKDYLRDFIDQRPPTLFRPFIERDPNPKYSTIPAKFRQLRNQMMAEESEREYGVQVTQPPPESVGDQKEPKAPEA